MGVQQLLLVETEEQEVRQVSHLIQRPVVQVAAPAALVVRVEVVRVEVLRVEVVPVVVEALEVSELLGH
jgi:hypothetical protein